MYDFPLFKSTDVSWSRISIIFEYLSSVYSKTVCQRRKWQPAPVFLPEKSHGWRSLAGYSPGVTKSQIWLSTKHILRYSNSHIINSPIKMCSLVVLVYSQIHVTITIAILKHFHYLKEKHMHFSYHYSAIPP